MRKIKEYFEEKKRNHPAYHGSTANRDHWGNPLYNFEEHFPGAGLWTAGADEILHGSSKNKGVPREKRKAEDVQRAKQLYSPGSLYKLLTRVFPESTSAEPWRDPKWSAHLAGFKSELKPLMSGATSIKAKSCPADCGRAEGHGVCNPYLGKCHCHLGWGGADCSERQKQKCNRDDNGWIVSFCDGECDDGYCRCGAKGKFPKRSMGDCPYWEYYLKELPVDKRTGASNALGDNLKNQGRKKESLFGDFGFCDADMGSLATRYCPCSPDRVGDKCSLVADKQVCPNLCSGRGQCRRGQCHCDSGAYGVDCSLEIDTEGFITLSSKAYPPRTSSVKKRPLVYVYELPPLFNAKLLAWRRREMGVPYEFDSASIHMTGYYYSIEFMLHEWLLSSEHRTLNPEEADFFYVPTYTALYNFEGDDHPQHQLFQGMRQVATAQMLAIVQQHLEKEYPYWKRRNGTDHMWILPWDEGSCTAPKHIRNSILIDHLGGRYGSENFCKTAYGLDCWAPKGKEFEGRVFGMATAEYDAAIRAVWTNPVDAHGGFACSDPDKDITMPPYKFSSFTAPSLKKKKKQRKRTRLFSFAGDLGKSAHELVGEEGGRIEERYSHGIRQALARQWILRIDLGMHLFARHADNYLQILEESVFCGVFVGDGWSGAVVDYVNHGCIPVFIHDTVGGPYNGVLDVSKFALQVPEVNITNLPYLLADVPAERVAQLQQGLAEVQSRFSYESWYRRLGGQLKHVHKDTTGMLKVVPKEGPDAFETLIEILTAKLVERESSQGEEKPP